MVTRPPAHPPTASPIHKPTPSPSRPCEQPLLRSQAREMRAVLAGLLAKVGTADPLWVVSPLTRALQTFMEACPFPDRMPRAGGPQPAQLINLQVVDTISEFLVTAGDIGRPAAHLRAEFPDLAEHLAHLKDAWWFQRPGKPNCALQKMISSYESKEDKKVRREGVCVHEGACCLGNQGAGSPAGAGLAGCAVGFDLRLLSINTGCRMSF